MHVEGDGDAVRGLAPAALHQVLCEAGGQVGLARAAGARQHDAPVLEQQADIVLHHGLGDQRLEHHAVHTLLTQAWGPHNNQGEEAGKNRFNNTYRDTIKGRKRGRTGLITHIGIYIFLVDFLPSLMITLTFCNTGLQYTSIKVTCVKSFSVL